jgi:hypothetical protein
VEFVWLSVLLLVPFVYGLVCLFDVQRTAFAVSVASRSAARAYLLSDNPHAARDRADLAARVALDDQRVKAATVTLTCIPRNACLQPESAVRVVVRSVVSLPLLGGEARWGGIAVDSTHTQSFGRFRSEER